MSQVQPAGTVEILYTLPDGTTCQRTWGQNGSTADQLIPGPGTAAANQNAITSSLAGALARLAQIQSQSAAFQAQAPYATANLANLNDLLSKSQTIAQAVGDLAQDLRYLVRFITNQYDASN